MSGGIPWWARPGQAVECVECPPGVDNPAATWRPEVGGRYVIALTFWGWRTQSDMRGTVWMTGEKVASVALQEDPDRDRFGYDLTYFRPIFPVQVEELRRQALRPPTLARVPEELP